MPNRRVPIHVLLVLGLGLGAVAWLVVLGSTAEAGGRTPLDVALPFALAAALATYLAVWARRERRAAAAPQAPPPPRDDEPVPLSADGERELVRVVAVLGAAGVLAPEPPDPTHLRESVADGDEPVTAEAVLRAVGEADHYHPAHDPARYEANLAFHDSHAEQPAEIVAAHVADLVRLAAGGLDDVTATVELDEIDGHPWVPTRVRLVVAGAPRALEYRGDVKYLSTVVHAELAGLLHARATGRRLAWLWCDQGVWLTGLPDGGAERLNAELGPAAGDGWSWVDDEPPMAAGDLALRAPS